MEDCGPPNPQLFEEFFLLNAFVRLEHLELASMLNMKPKVLRLPNLKSFRVHRNRGKLSIDSPKLQALCCVNGLDEVKIEHPSTITELKTSKEENLRDFPNVEIFKCSSPYLTEAGHILNELPKLKEFRLVADAPGLGRYETNTRLLADSLIAERKKRKSELKIFFMGHPLDGDRRFDDYYFKARFPHLLSDELPKCLLGYSSIRY